MLANGCGLAELSDGMAAVIREAEHQHADLIAAMGGVDCAINLVQSVVEVVHGTSLSPPSGRAGTGRQADGETASPLTGGGTRYARPAPDSPASAASRLPGTPDAQFPAIARMMALRSHRLHTDRSEAREADGDDGIASAGEARGPTSALARASSAAGRAADPVVLVALRRILARTPLRELSACTRARSARLDCSLRADAGAARRREREAATAWRLWRLRASEARGAHARAALALLARESAERGRAARAWVEWREGARESLRMEACAASLRRAIRCWRALAAAGCALALAEEKTAARSRRADAHAALVTWRRWVRRTRHWARRWARRCDVAGGELVQHRVCMREFDARAVFVAEGSAAMAEAYRCAVPRPAHPRRARPI